MRDLTQVAKNAPRQPGDRDRKQGWFLEFLVASVMLAGVWSWRGGGAARGPGSGRATVGVPASAGILPDRLKAGLQRRMILEGAATMSTPAEVRMARRVLRHELEAIRGNWGWILALGIILILVGTVA